MFNNAAIDVAIGLVFIYLLYSMLASIVQEAIAHWLDLRPRLLLRSISIMLDDVNKHRDIKATIAKINDGKYVSEAESGSYSIWQAIKDNLYLFKNPMDKTIRRLSQEFYSQPSIRFLKESDRSVGPSYITNSNFSETLLRMMQNDNVQPGADRMTAIRDCVQHNGLNLDQDTAKLLKHFLAESNADLDKFKAKLEGWFSDTQERTSGWYKKQTQLILFIIGLAMAMANNVDSIKIAKILSTNPLARQQVTQMAVEFQKQKTYQRATTGKDSISKNDIKQVNGQYDSLQRTATQAQQVLGLGWKDYTFDINPWNPGLCHRIWTFLCLIRFLPGWLITAAMISLGAPFWFDILNKIMQLRNSGKQEDGANKTSTPSQPIGPVPAALRKG